MTLKQRILRLGDAQYAPDAEEVANLYEKERLALFEEFRNHLADLNKEISKKDTIIDCLIHCLKEK